MTTGERLLDELEKAAEELMLYGSHDGPCSNQHQINLLPKVAPCTKHVSAMRAREERFRRALESFKLLRDVFGSQEA